jgi:hypothetical protein
MVIRVVSAVLWFVAIGWAANFASAFVGLPSILGLMVAAAGGVLIAVDPLKQLWPAPIETVARSSSRPADLTQVVQAGR